MNLSKTKADFLERNSLIKLFTAIENAGGKVRIVGGAIRNGLMGVAVEDIDLVSDIIPQELQAILQKAGVKTLPTGIDHGTITVICDGDSYEITTLREDIETDGRHAVVKFGSDWLKDAERRDLTMNALYCDLDGQIFDPLGVIDDVLSKTVRFIGSAEKRIEEDYLRILRFFRFFAWYGKGRPDGEGLKACAKLKSGLVDISVERIWTEFEKILNAPDPTRALLWMRTTGVLSIILPESEKWGIDLVHHVQQAKTRFDWGNDGLLFLLAMVPTNEAVAASIGKRLKLSNRLKARLTAWAMAQPIDKNQNKNTFCQLLYWSDRQSVIDQLKLEIARMVSKQEEDSQIGKSTLRLLKIAEKWKQPILPVKGQDFIKLGHSTGPKLGKKLKAAERKWVASNFKLSKEDLLKLEV